MEDNQLKIQNGRRHENIMIEEVKNIQMEDDKKKIQREGLPNISKWEATQKFKNEDDQNKSKWNTKKIEIKNDKKSE